MELRDYERFSHNLFFFFFFFKQGTGQNLWQDWVWRENIFPFLKSLTQPSFEALYNWL